MCSDFGVASLIRAAAVRPRTIYRISRTHQPRTPNNSSEEFTERNSDTRTHAIGNAICNCPDADALRPTREDPPGDRLAQHATYAA